MENKTSIVVVLLVFLGAATSTIDKHHPRHPKEDTRRRVHPLLGIEENESSFWIDKAQRALDEKLQVQRNEKQARNVILFLGDGMSIPTMTAARIYQSEMGGSKLGEGSSLFFEKFPYTGLSKTYCVDMKVADSACSSTAYLTGVKGNEGTIGVNGNVARGDCAAMRDVNNHVDSIAKWFQDAGRATGIVTTTRVTHASPAGAYAHTAERNWENDDNVSDDEADPDLCDDIARQLINNEPGSRFNVILGGGRKGFLPKSMDGDRDDDVNLVDEWIKKRGTSSHLYTTSRQGLLNMPYIPKYLLGLFGKSHLDYHLEKNAEQPTLAEMTKKALEVLQNTKEGLEEGFFLFVEGGKIDIAHHENLAHQALDETVEFAKAVAVAKSMTNDSDTLIIVTADHAHTMSLAGYPARASSIFGEGGEGKDKIPYSILSYANGPSFQIKNNQRHDISKDDMDDANYAFPAGAPLSSETHGGDDVAVFANGPWAHLFTGSFEENYLPHAMAFAACVGKGLTVCD